VESARLNISWDTDKESESESAERHGPNNAHQGNTHLRQYMNFLLLIMPRLIKLLDTSAIKHTFFGFEVI
jgi:hypothetical protein